MKNWIDRYLYAVGQKLPKAQREDITKELRSLILDALDEKTASDRLAKGEAYEEEEKEEDHHKKGNPDKAPTHCPHPVIEEGGFTAIQEKKEIPFQG